MPSTLAACRKRTWHNRILLSLPGGRRGGPRPPTPPSRRGGSLQPEKAQILHFHFSRCGQRPFSRCCKGKRFTVLGQFHLGKSDFQPGRVCFGCETQMSCAGASRGTVRVKPNSPHRLGGSPRAHVAQRMKNPGSEMARPGSGTGGGGPRGAGKQHAPPRNPQKLILGHAGLVGEFAARRNPAACNPQTIEPQAYLA